MRWFKQLMGLEAPAAKPKVFAEGPLGLAPGKGVTFDSSLALLLEGSTRLQIPGPQRIWSEGVVDLGQSVWLSRYYMDDEDVWLQVHTSGERAGQVESVIVFNYLDCKTISSDAELGRLAGPSSPIGLPSFTLEGVEYSREWGTEPGQTELVALSEQISNPSESYTVEHRSMLYARETGLTDRREFLLFSVEQDQQGNVSLSTSLGVSLYCSDLQSI